MRVYLLNARVLHLVYFRNATCVRGFINASINSAKKLRNGINVVGTRAYVVPTSIIQKNLIENSIQNCLPYIL